MLVDFYCRLQLGLVGKWPTYLPPSPSHSLYITWVEGMSALEVWNEHGLWVRVLSPRLSAQTQFLPQWVTCEWRYVPGETARGAKGKQVYVFLSSVHFCHLAFFPKSLTPLIISVLLTGADQVLLREGVRVCMCTSQCNTSPQTSSEEWGIHSVTRVGPASIPPPKCLMNRSQKRSHFFNSFF